MFGPCASTFNSFICETSELDKPRERNELKQMDGNSDNSLIIYWKKNVWKYGPYVDGNMSSMFTFVTCFYWHHINDVINVHILILDEDDNVLVSSGWI